MPRRSKVDHKYKPYDASFHPKDLIRRMKKRQLNVQVAASWRISISTFNRWRDEHKELEEAYQEGLAQYEDKFLKDVVEPMIQGKLEGRHSFNAAALIAHNKLGYNQGLKNTTSVNNTQVNINVDLKTKPVEQLKETIIKDIQYLIDYNVIDAETIEIKSNDPIAQSNK